MQSELFDVAEVEAARLATYPPPFPEGWYVVAQGSDLLKDPLQVRVAGNDLVLFRDATGKPRAVDAYCPHMGANLADGRVHDGCIECPFHGWRLDGSGRVVHIPKGLEPEPLHRMTSWPVVELHGWICMFHRHGELDRGPAPTPPYVPERLPEIEDGTLVHRGDYDAGAIHMHLLEFVENTVDYEHFEPIHGELRLPWTNVPVPGMRIEHAANWRRDETESHVSWFEDEAQLSFRGKPIPRSGAKARVRLEGPGSIVRFDFRIAANGGRVVASVNTTPL